MLEVSNLHLWRGERHLLRGVNFTLFGGQVLQMLWPNGTGKTSLLRCIAGFLHAEAGELRWQGKPFADERDDFLWNLAYLGHETALKGDLTAFENLHFACALRSPPKAELLRATLASVGLAKIDPDQPVRTFSAGQQRRVALARLSLWGAKLWLLDEPAANLDAAGQSVLTDLLQSHLQGGGMVILATHQALELPGADCRYWHAPQEVV
ncbi:MAG: cytochrome c biogenesis heme-transporting ATPase CcmA [Steroidobacteraceae bacterium]